MSRSKKNQTQSETKETLLNTFRDFLKEQGKTEATSNSYIRDITGYLECADATPEDFPMSSASISNYYDTLIHSHYKATTINTKVNSLLAFNKSLVSRGIADEILVDTSALRITTLKLLELRTLAKKEGHDDKDQPNVPTGENK